jgi:Arc/MetJ-type ribon-helix-helix transcriptional regulator
MPEQPSKQYTFRLPDKLVKRIDECLERIRGSGLTVSRTDVVRMLITHALDTVRCDVKELLA